MAAASDKPDLILLSIELPRMNGFSVCNKLKKDPALKDVPLIIMSSESSDDTFEQHRKLRTRAEDYVHKPIAFGELLSTCALLQLEKMGPPPHRDWASSSTT
jgi:DNA-binding response OmpR family regulator